MKANEQRAREYADRVIRGKVARGVLTRGTPEAASAWSEAYIQRWRFLNGQSHTTGPKRKRSKVRTA